MNKLIHKTGSWSKSFPIYSEFEASFSFLNLSVSILVSMSLPFHIMSKNTIDIVDGTTPEWVSSVNYIQPTLLHFRLEFPTPPIRY